MRMHAMYPTVFLSQNKGHFEVPQDQWLWECLLPVISAVIHLLQCLHLLCSAASVLTDKDVVEHHPHNVYNRIKLQLTLTSIVVKIAVGS